LCESERLSKTPCSLFARECCWFESVLGRQGEKVQAGQAGVAIGDLQRRQHAAPEVAPTGDLGP